MLLIAKSKSDLEISLMHFLSLFCHVQEPPLQGLQYLITTLFLPIGAVLDSTPTPKKETVGIPNAVETWPRPLSVAKENLQAEINAIDSLRSYLPQIDLIEAPSQVLINVFANPISFSEPKTRYWSPEPFNQFFRI